MEGLIFEILWYQKFQQGKLLKNGINQEDRRSFRDPCLLHSMETRLVKSLPLRLC